jgi:hypothetical protein
MKNQNDLIVSIVAGVVAIGVFCGFFFFGQRQVQAPPDPTPVPLGEPKAEEATIVFGNGLPGSQGGQGGFGGGGGFTPGIAGRGGPASGGVGRMQVSAN